MELAKEDPAYEDLASKFWEHFLYIANAMTHLGDDGFGMWDQADGFFYDVLRMPNDGHIPLKVRSMVGLIPLFAVETLEPGLVARLPGFKRRLEWFIQNRKDLASNVASMNPTGVGERRLMAIVNGDQLRFDVIRDRDGQQIVTTYSGKWDTNSIKGKVESNWAGEKQTFDWTAQRAHMGVEGTWKWNRSFGRGGGGRGRGFQERVELEQHGELLTGFMPGFAFGGRQAPKIEIKNGVFTNGVVYFEVERQRFGSDEKITSYYEGKQHSDTIKGFISTTNFDGEEVEYDWEAKRAD